MEEKLKLGTLFSGIGAPEVAIKKIFGDKYEDKVNSLFSCEIDDFATKSFLANHNVKKNFKDIYSIEKDDLPDELDLLVAGFPCFKAGHKILTKKGYKNIENIKKGEKVLTHTNQYKKVIKPMKKEVDTLYKLKIYGSKLHEVTEEHPYYIIEKTKENIFSAPKWVNVSKLEINNHFVGLNINKENKDIDFTFEKDIKSLYSFPMINRTYTKLPFEKEDFYWFLGRYLANNWTSNKKIKGYKKNKVVLYCSHKEDKEIEKKLNPLFRYTKVKKRTKYKYIICNTMLMIFVQKFGKYAHNKKIPKEILDLPISKLKYLIEGYLSQDGSYNETTKINRITTVSEELALGIQNIIHKIYKTPCKIKFSKKPNIKYIKGWKVNHKDNYTIEWKNNNIKQKAFEKDGYMWFPIKRKEKITNLKEWVYNFEVEKDNSYTINNLIVHNCQAFSSSGKGMGKEDICPNTGRNRGILYLEMMRIIKNTLPKVILLENVKGLTFKKHKELLDDLHKQLDDLGYYHTETILNTKDITGIPQSRGRWFLVGFLKDKKSFEKFNFPTEKVPLIDIKTILQSNKEISNKIYHAPYRYLKDFYTNLNDGSDGTVAAFTASREYQGFKNICPTLCAQEFKSPKSIKTASLKTIKKTMKKVGFDYEGFAKYMEKEILPKERPLIHMFKNEDFKKVQDIIKDKFGFDYDKLKHFYRKLSPIESLRLQGFSEDFIKKLKYGEKDQLVSNTQIYKQSGNSMTVDMMQKLIEKILEAKK